MMTASPAATRRLHGRHAVVTGGSRGIGAAIVHALLAEGAHVTIIGRHREALDQAVETAGAPSSLFAAVADVSDSAALDRALADARVRFGTITIMINNAGQAYSAPIRRIADSDWRRMISVNLDGTFYGCRAVAQEMVAAGWGRIVNVASAAGLVGYKYVSAYSAAKHGVIGLTRSLALELAASGVTVNAVCPGYTDTDMAHDAIDNIVSKTGRTPEEARAELVALNPQRRMVEPEEVANAVMWLVLPGSEAITGQSIAIAGGEVMR